MASVNKVEKVRSRSRSRTGRCSSDSSRRSSRKKTVKDSLSSGVPAICSHLRPPPYRPAGPFALYFAANHHDHHHKNEAMMLLAAKWNCLSEKEKAHYYNKAEEVKVAYLNKKAEFFSKRDELAVKWPISGYAMFIAHFASKNRGNFPCATDLICEGAKQWKWMSPVEKDVWNKQSLKSSESYAKQMWTVCKKKVRQRYGKYDARINAMKPVDFKPPGYGRSKLSNC